MSSDPRCVSSTISRDCGRRVRRQLRRSEVFLGARREAGPFGATAGANRAMRVVASSMRLVVIAIGRLKHGPERELAERYRTRFDDIGRKLGFRGLDIHELS